MAPKTFETSKQSTTVTKTISDEAEARASKGAVPEKFWLKFRDTLGNAENYELITGMTLVKGKKDPNKVFLMGNVCARGDDGKAKYGADGKIVIAQDFLLDISRVIELAKNGEI